MSRTNTNLQLRPHQSNALNVLRRDWKKYSTHLLQAPVGAGKTAIAAEIMAGLSSNGIRSLFVAPYVTLVEQTAKAFMDYGLNQPAIIWRDHPWHDPDNLIQIASADTLIRRDFPDVDVVIIDECFPRGTKIDGIPIEEIKVGDFVNSYNTKTKTIEKKQVLATSRNKTDSPIVSLYIKGHNRIDCTAGHRFYTKRGWVHAININKNDEVLIYELEEPKKIVRRMQVGISNFIRTIQKRAGKAVNKSILLQRMCKRIQKRVGSKAGEKDAREQSFEIGRSPTKNIEHASSYWAQTAYSTREWNRDDESGVNTLQRIKVLRFRFGASCKNWALQGWKWLSNMLQNRYSKQGFKAWYRGGWEFPLFAKKEGAGQKERKILVWKRLDDLEIRKQSDYWEHSGSYERNIVYNIEVEGNNNYLVEGVLAHNCHIKRAKLLKMMAEDSGIKWIGLSATPYANWMGKYYDNFIKVTTMRELINQGYLSDYDVYAPTKPNLKGVKTSNLAAYGKDYAENDLAEIMGDADIVGDIVKTWLSTGENQPTIAFCVNVSHANFVTVAFNRAGISAEVMTAETPTDERKKIVSRFESGVTKIICNVGVLVAGFDSDVRCIIYARPTKSEARWIQCLGRGLRSAEGKERCIILDHSGTVHRLGYPCSIEYDELISDKDGMSEQQRVKQEKERKEKKPKECPRCSYMKPAGQYVCAKCGYKPINGEDVEVDDSRELEIVKGNKKTYTMEQKQAFYSELLGYRNEARLNRGKNYSDGWVANQYRQRFNVWPKGLNGTVRSPTAETRNFIKSRMIAFAKGKQK